MADPAVVRNVRAIFFDAVGTLIHPDPGAGMVYAEVGRRHGSRLAAADIASRFAPAFQREERLDRDTGWITSETRERQRWQAIVADVLPDVTDPAACFADLFDHFSQPASWRCAGDIVETLTALTARGYRLGLASNFDRRLYRVAGGLPELVELAPILVSSEVGWRKPSASFFAALCAAVALPPEAILFVGDDPVNDYDGALRFGLQAVLLDPHERHAALAQRRIARLSELLNLPILAD